jgi:hypothetical protein
MAGMPRQGERSPFPVSVCIKEEKNPENAAWIGSTKSLSPLFCVPESVSVVVYSLAAIVSSEFQVNTNMPHLKSHKAMKLCYTRIHALR